VYKTEINKLNKNIKVIEKATPLLVPLIENAWSDHPETEMILERYLKPLREEKVSSLILACTHYQYLIEKIRKIIGKECKVYDPGKTIVLSLKDYLKRHRELKLKKDKGKDIIYYTTDEIKGFKQLGEKFLNREIINISKIKLI
ncbi:glutamate racemase, partial [Candidatus Falkowbacteria bacterium]|nr:glutamate racemase [Candidatus Falkowbacteria bacterium]